MSVFQFLIRLPWLLLISTSALVFIGALALYSASEGSWSPWAERQLLRAAIGTVLLFLVAFIPTRWLYNWSYLGIILIVLVLAALPFIGIGVGATRWIALGPFNFQPSEPAKLAVIVALARYLSSQTPEQMQSLLTYFPVLVFITVPFSLILDSARFRHIIYVAYWGTGRCFCCWLAQAIRIGCNSGFFGCTSYPWSQLYNYQKARILTFLNPDTDQLGGISDCPIKNCIGFGWIVWERFLMGSQSQLNYLPEKQTDFVFTMIGEEFGFIGNLAVLFTYFVILVSCLLVALRSVTALVNYYAQAYQSCCFYMFCEHWHGHRFVACSWCAASFNFLWRHSYVDCLYWAGTSCECGNSSASS